MDNTNKILSVIAYFLSKFDMKAVEALGYSSRSDAFENISDIFDKNNNYLKLRRDEFDVLTGSHRKGWRNREPSSAVLAMHEKLKEKSFDELMEIVLTLIYNKNNFV